MTKKPATKPKKKSGRPPSKFDQKIADRICEHRANGKGQREICQMKGMPSLNVLRRWRLEVPEFRDRYARAREDRAESLRDEAIQVAKNTTPERVNADRLTVDTLKWAASKDDPRTYGDRVGLDVSGSLEHTVDLDARNAWLNKPLSAMSEMERVESGRRAAWEFVCMGKLLTDAGFPAKFEEVAMQFAAEVNRYFVHGGDEPAEVPRLSAPIEINPLPAAGERPASDPEETPEEAAARIKEHEDLMEERQQQRQIDNEIAKQAQPGQVIRGPFRGRQ